MALYCSAPLNVRERVGESVAIVLYNSGEFQQVAEMWTQCGARQGQFKPGEAVRANLNYSKRSRMISVALFSFITPSHEYLS